MILVDASSCLHKCLHTSQANLTDNRGRYIGGVSGFLASVGAAVNRHRQQHFVICCWDSGVALHRRELYPEYKSHKTPIIDPFSITRSEKILVEAEGDQASTEFLDKYQIARRILHREILPYMGGLSIQVYNCEADDIIAYICEKITDEEIIILSSDRDLVQLLNKDRIFQDTRSNSAQTYALTDLIETHSLIPDKWRLHWLMARAIAGDSSDGVPGIPGIGFGSALEYAGQIVGPLGHLPLGQALLRIDKIKKGRQAAYDALMLGEKIIDRNLKLMDLRYPILAKLPMVSDIKTQIASAFVYETDPYRVERVLHEMGMNKTKAYANSIIESNFRFNTQDYIRWLT